MNGPANSVFRPDFTDYTTPQNALAPQPTWADAATYNAQAASDYIAQQRAESEQMGLWDPNTGLPTGAGVVNAAQQTGNALLMGTTAPGIRAFHGSPHDFERFDTSKIGTGEGAQAYGHGLYFAEKEGTARSYRDDLSQNLNQTESAAYRDASARKAAADAAMTDLHWKMVEDSKALGAKPDNPGWGDYGVEPLPEVLTKYQDQWDALAKQSTGAHNEMQEIVTGPRPKGSMYEVNIGADPEQFLHWDKPLSEQSPQVQDALNSIADKHGLRPEDYSMPVNYPDGRVGQLADGSTFYRALARKLNPGAGMRDVESAGAADTLNQAGIPGIRYLDQGSRGAGEGTHNYVVFDAATIDILRKYGLAGLGVGLSGAVAGTQQQNQ